MGLYFPCSSLGCSQFFGTFLISLLINYFDSNSKYKHIKQAAFRPAQVTRKIRAGSSSFLPRDYPYQSIIYPYSSTCHQYLLLPHQSIHSEQTGMTETTASTRYTYCELVLHNA